MLSLKILESQRIGDPFPVKSSSLVPDYHRQLFPQFTSAKNLDKLAGIESVAVQDCIVESLSKGQFNGQFFACNAARFFDQANHSVEQRRNRFDVTRHQGLDFEARTTLACSHGINSQIWWIAHALLQSVKRVFDFPHEET
jgi:hypothetical protein